jgi:N-acetyl-D-muramate 6-phosphate phosphatase
MPPHKIKAVLFDLDGTLADTAADMADTLNILLKKKCKKIKKLDYIRPFVSQGALSLIKLVFKDNTATEQEQLKNEYLRIYKNNFAHKTTLFPTVATTLETLRKNNILWGVVTNKPRIFAQPLLEHLNIYKNCAVLVCGDDLSNNKPHPEPLQVAAKKINTAIKNCVYVGDDIRDMQAANAAKMQCVIAKYGYIKKNENLTSWQADWTIFSCQDLIAIIM